MKEDHEWFFLAGNSPGIEAHGVVPAEKDIVATGKGRKKGGAVFFHPARDLSIGAANKGKTESSKVARKKERRSRGNKETNGQSAVPTIREIWSSMVRDETQRHRQTSAVQT
jgi:hypothetical protein